MPSAGSTAPAPKHGSQPTDVLPGRRYGSHGIANLTTLTEVPIRAVALLGPRGDGGDTTGREHPNDLGGRGGWVGEDVEPVP